MIRKDFVKCDYCEKTYSSDAVHYIKDLDEMWCEGCINLADARFEAQIEERSVEENV